MNSTPAAKPAPAYAIPGSEAKNTNPGAQSQVSYNFLFDNHFTLEFPMGHRLLF